MDKITLKEAWPNIKPWTLELANYAGKTTVTVRIIGAHGSCRAEIVMSKQRLLEAVNQLTF